MRSPDTVLLGGGDVHYEAHPPSTNGTLYVLLGVQCRLRFLADLLEECRVSGSEVDPSCDPYRKVSIHLYTC